MCVRVFVFRFRYNKLAMKQMSVLIYSHKVPIFYIPRHICGLKYNTNHQLLIIILLWSDISTFM